MLNQLNQNVFAIHLQSYDKKWNRFLTDTLATKFEEYTQDRLYQLDNIQRSLLLNAILLCAIIIIFYWILLLKNVRRAISINGHPYNTMICKLNSLY